MYRGKNCVEMSVQQMEYSVKWLYEMFPQQPVTKLTDVLKRERKAGEQCHIYYR